MTYRISGKTGDWELVCGLEVHCQIISNSKVFSGASASFGGEPNQHVSFLDSGMPGQLPVLNEECVRQCIKTGFGLNAQINKYSVFDRKNYFYGDLPTGYQITQLFYPIVGEGFIEVTNENGELRKIGVDRLHLEQDAAKSIHDMHPSCSYIDLNRAGVGLMEIVSKPDIRSPEEAGDYLRKLRSIIRYLGTCDGNMDEGSMRCDINVSVRKVGEEGYRHRVEIKNVNSVKFVMQAIDLEVHRQVDLYEAGQDFPQETRLFDAANMETRSMRSKENALDYRYFPDPDLPPLCLTDEYIEKIRKNLPELPEAKKARYMSELGLPEYDARIIVADKETATYFEKASEWADKTIDGQGLTMSFHDKWWPFNENNAEEIFSVQYQREGYVGDIAEGGHNLQGSFGHLYGGPTDSGLKASAASLCPSTKAIYLWDEGDERWTGTFMQVMYNSKKDNVTGIPAWGNEGYFAYYNNEDNSHLDIAFAYFPYYVSKSDVKDWVAEHKDRFSHSTADNVANNRAGLFIIGDPMEIIYLDPSGNVAEEFTLEYHAGGKRAQAGVSVRKYDDPLTAQEKSSTNTCYRDIQLFHLSDIYLIAAEAYLMAGEESKALRYLNDVRKRAKATELASFEAYNPMYVLPENYEITALDVLLDERARELFGENEGRWIDLRRTKQLVRYNVTFNNYINSVADMSNNKGEVKWLRPIPEGDISTNEGINPEDQNPGY